jgi:hypothetical protein
VVSHEGPGSVTALATAVLERNWKGSHTLPATGLYPHQWSWDSGFIAIGLRHISPRRAGQELDALFAGQWADGRIPQIVFDPHRDQDYSPGASFWQSRSIDQAPDDVETAGLIQPPNHAWAVWKIHQSDPAESRRRGFLARAYPKLVAWHRYLATKRDRGGNGLAAIVHPWESGTDNSPLWDDALAYVPSTAQTPFERPDLLHADSSERPSDRDYGKYFWLAERYRDHQCDDADADYPFLVEDPLFNALHAVSELALARIAGELGLEPSVHVERATEITEALEQLWDDELGCYVARDVTTGRLIRKATINGLIPLLVPGLPRAAELLDTLTGPRFLGSGAVLVPSYDATAGDMQPSLYWRGPAWFNMAWLMAIAANEAGDTQTATTLSESLQDLAVRHNFPEYVNPWTGRPHGTQAFSWTAALAIDAASPEGLRLL